MDIQIREAAVIRRPALLAWWLRRYRAIDQSGVGRPSVKVIVQMILLLIFVLAIIVLVLLQSGGRL